MVKGRIEPPKTRHGRREVQLPAELVTRLREQRMALGRPNDDALVFASGAGTALDPGNLRRRVLKPAATKAGAAWAAFHTFRHTYASLILASGANILQLSRALGHHSPAFTLTVYTHLLEGEHAPALDLRLELGPTATAAARAA